LGGESKGKEPQGVHAYIPYQIPKRKVSKLPQEIHQEKGSENNQKGETRKTQPSFEEPRRIIYTYHEGSYKVYLAAQSSFPLTRSHHKALKLVLEIPTENGMGK
jgi:hypothetical protein